MNAAAILFRLQRFLLVLSGFLFAGTIVELVSKNHTEDPVQWIPFILCGVGLMTIGWFTLRPGPRSLLALRVSMVLVAIGSQVGFYEHYTNNVGFQLEIQPTSTTAQTILAGFTGANPLLAPGILCIAAVLALAATYGWQ